MLYSFFLVILRASEFYAPTFRDTVPSSPPMEMEQTVFRNVGT